MKRDNAFPPQGERYCRFKTIVGVPLAGTRKTVGYPPNRADTRPAPKGYESKHRTSNKEFLPNLLETSTDFSF